VRIPSRSDDRWLPWPFLDTAGLPYIMWNPRPETIELSLWLPPMKYLPFEVKREAPVLPDLLALPGFRVAPCVVQALRHTVGER
jgi:hypothetical protein